MTYLVLYWLTLHLGSVLGIWTIPLPDLVTPATVATCMAVDVVVFLAVRRTWSRKPGRRS